jgi:glycosyltransferase involved in cell wall biosynthesis
METTTNIVDHSEVIGGEVHRNLWSLLGRKPRVLVYTSLFPNSVEPVHGNFILERMRHLIPFVDMSVVAPVPYFPRVNISRRWFKYALVPHTERFSKFEVAHPRYLVIPKLGMVTHGISMFAGSLRQVARRFDAADYDLIDAHYVYPDGLAATMLGARFNKPVVVSARGSDINLFSHFRTIRPMIHRVLKDANKVVAVTRSLKDTMVELGCPPGKISVIGNGIDAVKFQPEARATARAALSLPVDSPIVLSVGHLKENKGFHVLIDAIALLRTKFPDVRLIIVGDGPIRNRLENQIRVLKLQGNVLMPGVVRHEDLSTWYSAADVFCLASESEGCPNVILEAMACGCPVVATRAGGVPDLVSSPLLGTLVDRTSQSFYVALQWALNRDWDRAAIVSQARSHGWDNVASQLLKIYSEVINAPARMVGSKFKSR